MSNREIEQLIYQYARLIDSGNFEAVAQLFSSGRIQSAFAEPKVGYEEVLAMYQASTRLYEDGTPKTRHVTTNVSVTIDGTNAEAHSYFTVMQALPDFPLQAIISGSYEDTFKLENDVWRFECRTMFPDLLGDLSRHLLFDSESLQT